MNNIIANRSFNETGHKASIINVGGGRFYDVENRTLTHPDGTTGKLNGREGAIYEFLLRRPGYSFKAKEVSDTLYPDMGLSVALLSQCICKISLKLSHVGWEPLTKLGHHIMANMDFDEPKPDKRIDIIGEKYCYGHQYEGGYFDKRNGLMHRFGYDTQRLNPAIAKMFSELARHPDETVLRDKLLDIVAIKGKEKPEPKIIDVYICHLRAALKKLELPEDMIKNVLGEGYRFNPGTLRQ